MYNKILLNQLIQNGGDNVLEQLNSQSIKSNGLNNNIPSFGRSESNFKPKSTINSYKELEKIMNSSTYELRVVKYFIIGHLKYITYYLKSIKTEELTKEERKEILSYVYDLIITLDDLVNELEKDSPNE